MRLIDAKALEKQAKEAFKESPVLMGMFLRWIRKQPTIDAVPVVRCGECEKRDKSFVPDNDTVCCPYMEAFMPKDGFCSYGERKDGEG